MAEAKSRRESATGRPKRAKTEFAADLQDELPPLPAPPPAEPAPKAEAAPKAEEKQAEAPRFQKLRRQCGLPSRPAARPNRPARPKHRRASASQRHGAMKAASARVVRARENTRNAEARRRHVQPMALRPAGKPRRGNRKTPRAAGTRRQGVRTTPPRPANLSRPRPANPVRAPRKFRHDRPSRLAASRKKSIIAMRKSNAVARTSASCSR